MQRLAVSGEEGHQKRQEYSHGGQGIRDYVLALVLDEFQGIVMKKQVHVLFLKGLEILGQKWQVTYDQHN